MRAVQMATTGGPEVLRVVDAPEPSAGPGQVRIRVRAAGINPVDWKMRSGLVPAPSFPYSPGLEASGVVDQVGENVDGVAPGDEVFGPARGAYAEFAVLPLWTVKPAGMTFEEAASLPVAVETSVRTLGLLDVADGTTLVINGAAGGVGSVAVQLAVARGATVIGTASPGNHDYLRQLGAVPTTYGPGLADRVRALVPRVDRALDAAGQGALPDLVALTGEASRVVTIADMSAQQHGVTFSSSRGALPAEGALEDAVTLAEGGRLQLAVQAVFPLESAGEAQTLSQGGHVRGKVILRP